MNKSFSASIASVGIAYGFGLISDHHAPWGSLVLMLGIYALLYFWKEA